MTDREAIEFIKLTISSGIANPYREAMIQALQALQEREEAEAALGEVGKP